MTQSPFEKCLQDLKALKEVDPSLSSDPQVLAVVRANFLSVHSPAPLLLEERATPALPSEEKAVEISSETVVTEDSSLVGIPRFFKGVYGADPDHKTELFKAVRNRFVGAFGKEPQQGTVFVPTRFPGKGKEVNENQYPVRWLRNELEKIRKTNPCHWKLCNS